MAIRDGRKLDARNREQISREAVQRVVFNGESPEVVIRELGFARATIYNWLARYRAHGWDGLKSGKASGRPKSLSNIQLRWIRRTLIGGEPRQYDLSFALWTTEAIREALNKKHEVRLSTSSVGRLLKQLGFSCQSPLDRAYLKNPEFVERWQAQEFSRIRAEAKQCKALIYFVGVSELRADHHSAQNSALKDRLPVIRSTGIKYNLIGATSTRKLLKFMVVEGIVRKEQVCQFLYRLSKETARPVFVVWDDHPLHRSEKVLQLIDSLEGKLRVFYLPASLHGQNQP